MQMNSVFITATDTGAGKTWVTAGMIRSLLVEGMHAIALKPIACGKDAHGHNEDITTLLTAQNMTDAHEINRYHFDLAAAPAQAAAAQCQSIDPTELLQWCEQQAAATDICLIEGVGGLMVPITERWLVSDWIAAMPDFDIWLVVDCKLGAINQTLLSLAQLKQMGRMPTKVFFNAPTAAQNEWLQPTLEAVSPFLNSNCIVESIRFNGAAISLL